MAEHYVTTLTVWDGKAWLSCKCGWLGAAAKDVTLMWHQHRLAMEQAERAPARPSRLGFPSKAPGSSVDGW